MLTAPIQSLHIINEGYTLLLLIVTTSMAEVTLAAMITALSGLDAILNIAKKIHDK